MDHMAIKLEAGMFRCEGLAEESYISLMTRPGLIMNSTHLLSRHCIVLSPTPRRSSHDKTKAYAALK